MPGSLINVLLTGANNDQHAAGIGTARLPGDHRLLGRCNWYPFFSVVFSQSRVVSSSLPRFISHPATGALASSADSDEEELFVGFRTVPGGSRAPRYCRRSILSLSRFFLFFLPFVLCLFLGIPKGMQTNRLRKRRRKNGIIEEKENCQTEKKLKSETARPASAR